MFDGMFELFNEEKKEDNETEITYPRDSSSQAYSAPGSKLFVVSIGGSVLFPGKPDSEAIRAVASCINGLLRQGIKLVLVVGGGKVARDYVSAARASGASNFELDELGIMVTRANAMLLIPAIENAFPQVLTDVKQAKNVLGQGMTPVFGGLMPGFTTDAVAALLAEYLGATFVNLSKVEGIFSADPAAYPSARMYREISFASLLELLVSNSMRPGQNLVLDLPAAMVLKRSGITGFFLGGHDLENFRHALQGDSFSGTMVGPNSEDVFADEAVPKRRSVSRGPAKRKASRRKPGKKTVRRFDDEEELDPDKIRF